MKTYPLFYFSRGSDAKNKERCDLFFVLQRMEFIPGNLKNEVSNTYDNMMIESNGAAREQANKYLNEVALKYRRVNNDARASVTDRVGQAIKDKALKSKQEAPKLKTDTMTPPAAKEPLKRGFMDKLLDDVDAGFKNKA